VIKQNGETVTIDTNTAAQGAGQAYAIAVEGSKDVVSTGFGNNAISVTGQNDRVSAQGNITVRLGGAGNVLTLSGGGQNSVDVTGSGDTVNASSSTVTLEAGVGVTVNGSSDTISVTSGAVLTATGTGDRIGRDGSARTRSLDSAPSRWSKGSRERV